MKRDSLAKPNVKKGEQCRRFCRRFEKKGALFPGKSKGVRFPPGVLFGFPIRSQKLPKPFGSCFGAVSEARCSETVSNRSENVPKSVVAFVVAFWFRVVAFFTMGKHTSGEVFLSYK